MDGKRKLSKLFNFCLDYAENSIYIHLCEKKKKRKEKEKALPRQRNNSMVRKRKAAGAN